MICPGSPERTVLVHVGTYWFNALVGATVNASAGTLTLDSSPQYGLVAGQPFYAFNLLEEIDTPGEYYINRDTGKLYLLAPETMTADSDLVLSQMTDELLELRGTEYLTFQGITFEGS